MSPRRRHAAFTLIELIIVIVIIAILVAIAIPQYRNFTQNAKDNSAQSDAKVTVTAVKANAQTQTRNAECAEGTNTLVTFLRSANPDMSGRITAAPTYMSAVTQTTGKPISVWSNGSCSWSVATRSDSGKIIAYGEELVSGSAGAANAVYAYSRSGYSGGAAVAAAPFSATAYCDCWAWPGLYTNANRPWFNLSSIGTIQVGTVVRAANSTNTSMYGIGTVLNVSGNDIKIDFTSVTPSNFAVQNWIITLE